jgi:hypothetical protein
MGFFSKERQTAEHTPSAAKTDALGNINFGEEEAYRDKLSSQPIFTAQKLKTNYSIDDAIKLLRKLSHIDGEVKIIVAKTTLESMNVVISDLIKEAQTKEENITDQIILLKKEIDALQAEIKKRTEIIATLEADFAETKSVKTCLAKGEPQNIETKTSAKSEPEPTPVTPVRMDAEKTQPKPAAKH